MDTFHDILSLRIEQMKRDKADELSKLKICRKCFEIYGPVRLEDGQVVEQKCYCDIPRHDEKWVVTNRYSYDFNQKYAICRCCGLEIIPSGSRWSPFYCDECKNRISKLNELVRKCIIPYGRHSIMNGVALNHKQIKDKKAIDTFIEAVNKMNQKIDIVEKHRKTITQKQLELLQMDENVFGK